MIDGNGFTQERIEALRKHVHHPVVGQLAMIEAYETRFGILDHDSEMAKADSLALVRMNEAEEPVRFSPFEERIRHFAEKEIHKHFGLSLTELLDYPRHIVNLIYEVAEDIQKEEYRRTSNTTAKLEQELNSK